MGMQSSNNGDRRNGYGAHKEEHLSQEPPERDRRSHRIPIKPGDPFILDEKTVLGEAKTIHELVMQQPHGDGPPKITEHVAAELETYACPEGNKSINVLPLTPNEIRTNYQKFSQEDPSLIALLESRYCLGFGLTEKKSVKIKTDDTDRRTLVVLTRIRSDALPEISRKNLAGSPQDNFPENPRRKWSYGCEYVFIPFVFHLKNSRLGPELAKRISDSFIGEIGYTPYELLQHESQLLQFERQQLENRSYNQMLKGVVAAVGTLLIFSALYYLWSRKDSSQSTSNKPSVSRKLPELLSEPDGKKILDELNKVRRGQTNPKVLTHMISYLLEKTKNTKGLFPLPDLYNERGFPFSLVCPVAVDRDGNIKVSIRNSIQNIEYTFKESTPNSRTLTLHKITSTRLDANGRDIEGSSEERSLNDNEKDAFYVVGKAVRAVEEALREQERQELQEQKEREKQQQKVGEVQQQQVEQSYAKAAAQAEATKARNDLLTMIFSVVDAKQDFHVRIGNYDIRIDSESGERELNVDTLKLKRQYLIKPDGIAYQLNQTPDLPQASGTDLDPEKELQKVLEEIKGSIVAMYNKLDPEDKLLSRSEPTPWSQEDLSRRVAAAKENLNRRKRTKASPITTTRD